MIDYHIHTSLCGHARGTMEEYVKHALTVGLTEIGFSGHYPYPEAYDFPVPDCVIPDEGKFDEFISEARRLRALYSGRVRIRIGAEVDYLGEPCSFHPMKEAVRLGLDFCMGSVHIVQGLVVDYTPKVIEAGLGQRGWDMDELYERYYSQLLDVAAPGFCTTLGHLDLVKKLSGFEGLAPRRDHLRSVDRILDALAASGTVMEINTAGWDKPCGEQYPALEIIRRAVDKGVRITAGSDAHAPEEVGRYFGRLKAILGQVGVTRLVGFEKLEAVEIEL